VFSGKHHAFRRMFPLGQGLNSTLKYKYITMLPVDAKLFLRVMALHAFKYHSLLKKGYMALPRKFKMVAFCPCRIKKNNGRFFLSDKHRSIVGCSHE